MTFQFSPRTLISIGALLCLLVATAVIHLALSLPMMDIHLRASSDAQKLLLHATPGGLNTHVPPGEVRGMVVADQFVPATTDWIIEEPDVLPDFPRLNQLYEHQRLLASADRLELVMADDSRHTIRTGERHWHQLPALFWLQLLFGIGGAMTGILVWSSRRHNHAAGLYALTGIGYLIFAPAAAIYSTRELIIDGDLFRLLSAINHFGALLFTASLTALLSQYPRALVPFKFTGLIFALAGLVWLSDYRQWHSPMVFHFGVLGVFAASFVFALWQWRATKADPVGRAALRWFLLSIYLATGLFACFIILPAALQLPQPASQGLMFGAFLLMYWGLALGIVRYRLFDLHQWWHAIMTWFLGGVCVLVLDAVLILSLAMPADLALSLSLAISGWLYFPVRQFIWNRWGKHKAQHTDSWLPDVLPLLLRDTSIDTQRWKKITQTLFHSASAEISEGSQDQAQITDDGMSLVLPDFTPNSDKRITLSGADGGSRLFVKADIACWRNLMAITHLASEVHQAEKKGAELERQRIRRDIHDDIGARLLTLLHSVDKTQQPLIRETLAATRALVTTLNQQLTPWAEALGQWQDETTARVEAAGKTLHWHGQSNTTGAMDARTYTNLTRILREAVSNALRYGDREQGISVSCCVDAQGAQIAIENSIDTQSAAGVGSGRGIMTERASEIGAELQILCEGQTHRLTLKLPLNGREQIAR